MSNLSSSAQTAALIASMQAAAQARLATPAGLRVAFSPLPSGVRLTESECAEIDMSMHRDKLWTGNPPMDGYERRRQAQAIALEQRSRRFE